MVAYPEMIEQAARDAGIEVPEDLYNFEKENYAHWVVFANALLGSPQPFPGCHWYNAKIIASIPKDAIINVTMKDLEKLGFVIGYSK